MPQWPCEVYSQRQTSAIRTRDFAAERLLERAEGALHDAVVDPGAGALLVFRCGKAEEQKAAESELRAGLGFLDGFVDGEIEDARHGGDFAADAFAFGDEERVDEGAGMQVRFADERAHGRGGAEAAQAGRGEVHGFSVVASAWSLWRCPKLIEQPRQLGRQWRAQLQRLAGAWMLQVQLGGVEEVAVEREWLAS